MDTLKTIKINNKDYDMSSPNSDEYKERYINSFGDTVTDNVIVNIHNINGPFIELKGDSKKTFKVEILNSSDDVIYTSNLTCGMYSNLNIKYYIDWKYKIYLEGELVNEGKLSLQNSRVFISMDSRSLGDTVAWISYCEEFRKKHNCKLIVSSFWNKFFINTYPNIEFVYPGDVVYDITAMYTLGWFYNKDKEPELPNTIPLQKTASNILGLEYKEITPTLDFKIGTRIFNEKYVTIATHSTAGCKYWNNPNGWQELVNYLRSQGYRILHVSKEPTELEGVTQLKDTSIENTMSAIYHSEFFVGLSSGLSWLSWGIGTPVVMISNFTEKDHEFTINSTRIINHSVCNGCWNNPSFKFDKGDWNWCPEHKGTERQFECHKTITSEMVIEQIQHLIK